MKKTQEHHNIIRESRNFQRGYDIPNNKLVIKEILKDNHLDLIQLRNNTSSVIICPEKGGTCISLELGGNRLFYNDPSLRNNPATTSRESHWMGPHAGPLHQDIQNKLGYNLPRHGFLRDVAWKMGVISDNSISLTYESDESTLKQFPHPIKLTQIITLGEYEIILKLEITNTGQKVMPFAPGHHTYYRVPVEQQKHIKFTGINIDSSQLENITTGKEVVKIPNPGQIKMKSPGKQDIIMSYGPEYKQIRLWSENKKGHFCVEPVVCHSDQFETEALQIKPGETKTIEFSIKLDISQ